MSPLTGTPAEAGPQEWGGERAGDLAVLVRASWPEAVAILTDRDLLYSGKGGEGEEGAACRAGGRGLAGGAMRLKAGSGSPVFNATIASGKNREGKSTA
ncbi:MAG: hypothetical protein MUC60_08925 [Oscillatoria sp. Prado101]|nr:hypothetical protein [Oscillatoria sp. Prado101]